MKMGVRQRSQTTPVTVPATSCAAAASPCSQTTGVCRASPQRTSPRISPTTHDKRYRQRQQQRLLLFTGLLCGVCFVPMVLRSPYSSGALPVHTIRSADRPPPNHRNGPTVSSFAINRNQHNHQAEIRQPHTQPSTTALPRVVFLDGAAWSVPSGNDRRQILDDIQLDRLPTQDDWEPSHPSHCLPKAAWQESSFPNCNSLHELSIDRSWAQPDEETTVKVLGEGWFRTTWQLNTPHDQTVVKTLRIARDFNKEYYELHRRDAVAMERLTSSPFVVNIYGYCGQSAMNELADFSYPGIQNLENFNKRMRGQYTEQTNRIKLRMAASVALGVADIHAAGSTNPDDENVYMVHYDLNHRNIALMRGGKPKINDFNVAEFLRYDPATNQTCPFPSRLHEPWWRAPEEMNTTHHGLIDEKVDIYALGNILYHTLTTHSARGRQRKERMDKVRPLVAEGVRPIIPELFANSTDPNVVAIIKAIDLCWEKDPKRRASAEEVASVLYETLLNMTDIGSGETVPQTASNVDDDDDEEEDDEPEDKNAVAHV